MIYIPNDEELHKNLQEIIENSHNFKVEESLHGINWFSFLGEELDEMDKMF